MKCDTMTHLAQNKFLRHGVVEQHQFVFAAIHSVIESYRLSKIDVNWRMCNKVLKSICLAPSRSICKGLEVLAERTDQSCLMCFSTHQVLHNSAGYPQFGQLSASGFVCVSVPSDGLLVDVFCIMLVQHFENLDCPPVKAILVPGFRLM